MRLHTTFNMTLPRTFANVIACYICSPPRVHCNTRAAGVIDHRLLQAALAMFVTMMRAVGGSGSNSQKDTLLIFICKESDFIFHGKRASVRLSPLCAHCVKQGSGCCRPLPAARRPGHICADTPLSKSGGGGSGNDTFHDHTHANCSWQTHSRPSKRASPHSFPCQFTPLCLQNTGRQELSTTACCTQPWPPL